MHGDNALKTQMYNDICTYINRELIMRKQFPIEGYVPVVTYVPAGSTTTGKMANDGRRRDWLNTGCTRRRRAKRVVNKVLSRSSVRRLARRGGVRRLAEPVYDEVRDILKSFVENLLRKAVVYTRYRRRETISASDVVSALRTYGIVLYGYM
uniref:Histone H4 n=1 Tax=Trypanosoma congolense (strain IL3000) TaxID=1068625 RepID=F9W948_TRYCI|nr:unnamed protein product [Trypanosoma congolense IL3000]